MRAMGHLLAQTVCIDLRAAHHALTEAHHCCSPVIALSSVRKGLEVGQLLGGGSRWCTLREALPRALPPGLAEALKPGRAGNVCTGTSALALSTPQGQQCERPFLQSACLTVVERVEC